MSEINVAVTTGKRKTTLMASGGVIRKDNSTTIGGYQNFDTNNRFRYYQQLAVATPHVFTSLNKLGLSLVKGMKFDGKAAKYIRDFENWSRKVNFMEQVQTLARLLCRDGTYIATSAGNPENMSLKPLYMPAVTIWPESSVWVEFEELSRPNMTAAEVLEWYNSGVLSREQLLEWGGFFEDLVR